MTSLNKRWLHRHQKDVYFKRAKQEGYPSRAAYKLLDIQAKDRLLKPGMVVVDLGAAPGGWSAVAKTCIGDGILIAVDLLPMSVPGVTFIQGDFNDMAVFDQLQRAVRATAPGVADVVMSDMAPNLSGIASIDQPRALHLMELAFDAAQKILKPNGSFLTKMFQGEGSDAYLAHLRRHFKRVRVRKPSASRPQSRELYMLCSEFLGYNLDGLGVTH